MNSEDHKRCLGCGYILDGLPEPRCPECGRGFDPDDASTYARPLEVCSGRTCVTTALAVMGVVVLLLVAGVTLIDRPVARAILEVLGAFVLVACLFADGLVVTESIRVLRFEPDEAARRPYQVALVLVALTIIGSLAVGLILPAMMPVRSMP